MTHYRRILPAALAADDTDSLFVDLRMPAWLEVQRTRRAAADLAAWEQEGGHLATPAFEPPAIDS